MPACSLQIDDPQLVTHYMRNPELSIEEYRRWAEQHVELLNHALRDIPREQIRFHTCYSVAFGPRIHDMELKDVIDLVVKIRAGAHSFEAANPRHEHEWKLWESVKLPEGTILIPGVITQSTAVVEHPELVAQRIERFAGIVGKENVIAGRRLRLRQHRALRATCRPAWSGRSSMRWWQARGSQASVFGVVGSRVRQKFRDPNVKEG